MSVYKGFKNANYMADGVDLLNGEQYHYFMDDMRTYDATATVGDWASVSDGGTVAQTDAVAGNLSIATGAVDNNETYISSIAETWLLEAQKPLWFEARVKLTEANTDDANIVVGLSDVVAANTLVDDGAGLVTTFDGALFYKIDGSMLWRFGSSNATTQVLNANAGTYASNTWYRLGFYYDGNVTTGHITPYLDGVAGTVQDITNSGLAEMHILLGVKAGGGNAETLLVDYVKVVQRR